MPPGTPYNSFIPPYRIRVDEFSGPSSPQDATDALPLFHLLTHTHSDHINGLSAKSFGYQVICSQDAKEMLLRHEVYAERELKASELRVEKIRTYAHLKVDPLCNPDGTKYYSGSRDLLVRQWDFVFGFYSECLSKRTIPLHTPTSFELTANESVTITSLDANHCPGAVMYTIPLSSVSCDIDISPIRYLIEGPRGTVLHTGDFRAEPWFLQSVMRNPFLQPYLAPKSVFDDNDLPDSSPRLSKTLEAIYLDTACVLSPFTVPSKVCFIRCLVQLMKPIIISIVQLLAW